MKVDLLKDKFRELPEINVERGLQFSVNSIKNYRKALYMALKSIKFKLPLILNMIEEKEYEGLGVIAHTLMQLLDNIGEESLVYECVAIETLLLNGKMDELELSLGRYVKLLQEFMVRLESAIPAIDELTALEISSEGDFSQRFIRRNQLVEEIYPKRKTV